MNQVRAVVSDIELCAYLDGELPAERRGEIEAWLARQPEARAKLDAWRRQGHLLRASFGRIAQEPLPRQITAALVQPAAQSGKVTPMPQPVARREAAPARVGEPALKAPEPRSRWRTVAIAVLVASSAIGLIITSAMNQTGAMVQIAGPGDTQAEIASPGYGLTRHAAEAHIAYAPRGDRLLDVRSADVSVLAASAAQVGFDARLPGAAPGLRTIGLRLTPTEGGLAGVILFDSEKNGRISLFVAHGGRGSAPGLVLRQRDGLIIASFVVDGVAYALTGAAPRDQMVDWASALRGSLIQPRSLRGS